MRTTARFPRGGFTLIELMLVIMIMALLGSVAVGGYRAMMSGISERGVMQSASMFIQTSYQRCQIDRVPVMICFWNETMAEEDEDAGTATRVVGKATAVRRGGRISSYMHPYLIDEFGDLEPYRYINSDGEYDDKLGLKAAMGDKLGGNGMYLYRMTANGGQVQRSLVSQIAVPTDFIEPLASDGLEHRIIPYAYYVLQKGNAAWQSGDAYGVPFNEITLPTGFIFGGQGAYSKTTTSPIKGEKSFLFEPGEQASDTIRISELRANGTGDFTATGVGDTTSPTKEIKN